MKNATPKQRVFALVHFRYIDFPGDFQTEKRFVSLSFFSDISNVFFNSFNVVHHSHVNQEIFGFAHNFCNEKIRELTGKSRQYFSYVFPNGFRFDMSFLTKGPWLSLWQTQDVSLSGSGLTTLKSYSLGPHIKLMDSAKYYKQPAAKLVGSTNANKKKRIHILFLDYLGYTHPYCSKFFLNLGEENIVCY